MNTYSIKPTTTEDFTAAFPSQATIITGKPTYDDIRQLRTIIYENAVSVNSSRGGGNNGQLGMVMNPTTYATLSPMQRIDPPEPPDAPVIIAGATGPQISKANHLHTKSLSERCEFQNLDKALIRIIIDSIEPLFLKPFHQPYVGLLGKSTQQVVELLINTYGFIMPHELEANREQLTAPYDATSEPFQILIDWFEGGSHLRLRRTTPDHRRSTHQLRHCRFEKHWSLR